MQRSSVAHQSIAEQESSISEPKQRGE